MVEYHVQWNMQEQEDLVLWRLVKIQDDKAVRSHLARKVERGLPVSPTSLKKNAFPSIDVIVTHLPSHPTVKKTN